LTDTFLKLGGALITDKSRREHVRRDVLARVLEEVATWHLAHSGRLLLAHGSGSFAHFAVIEHGLRQQPGSPLALARVAASARRLNTIVVDGLLDLGVPAVGVPGSLLAELADGEIALVRADIVSALGRSGVLPVVYGDAAPDRVRRSGIADTERLLAGLAEALRPQRIVLATAVDGVHVAGVPAPVPVLQPADEPAAMAEPVEDAATGGAVDVTGSMAGKVATMRRLLAALPHVDVRIVSGLVGGRITAALDGVPDVVGTRIAPPEHGQRA
jgi:isopentenyl phosphate kinase